MGVLLRAVPYRGRLLYSLLKVEVFCSGTVFVVRIVKRLNYLRGSLSMNRLTLVIGIMGVILICLCRFRRFCHLSGLMFINLSVTL